MSRVSLSAVALLLGAAAAPAAPLPLEVRNVPGLAGTTWVGNNLAAGEATYVFGPNGVLTCSYGGATHRINWTQTGATVYWDFGDKYSEYRCTVRGDEMTGKAWNQNGAACELKIVRKK